jgi:hypothetical protein
MERFEWQPTCDGYLLVDLTVEDCPGMDAIMARVERVGYAWRLTWWHSPVSGEKEKQEMFHGKFEDAKILALTYVRLKAVPNEKI